MCWWGGNFDMTFTWAVKFDRMCHFNVSGLFLGHSLYWVSETWMPKELLDHTLVFRMPKCEMRFSSQILEVLYLRKCTATDNTFLLTTIMPLTTKARKLISQQAYVLSTTARVQDIPVSVQLIVYVLAEVQKSSSVGTWSLKSQQSCWFMLHIQIST